MSKVAVVYWSGTGNTEAMANVIAKAVDGELFTPDQFDADKVDTFDAIAFGCSSQGNEELEDSEFLPMFESVKTKLNGKKIALFGSYGWGDGEWMRNWEADCDSLGANRVTDSVICCEAPDDDANAALEALAKKLAE
ncbi:MAG: flavodoxin [Clostridia bacterium]|nr:flavodoxin [Clostridia bacterium]